MHGVTTEDHRSQRLEADKQLLRPGRIAEGAQHHDGAVLDKVLVRIQGPLLQNRRPTLNSVSTPNRAKMTAAMRSPSSTAGTFASIMPKVVPVTTANKSV